MCVFLEIKSLLLTPSRPDILLYQAGADEELAVVLKSVP
jgi:hypothetical protein